MNKKTIKDIDPAGKTVLVRVDFNVPVDEAGGVADDTRIVAALPTINYLLDHQAKVVLASHFGRPKGIDEKWRMNRIAEVLQDRLGKPVRKVDDCIGPAVQAAVKAMQPGEVLLLENVRFHAQEEKNDPDFARQLASIADIYVNDAFGAAHRAHASTEGVAHCLPAVAGFLMQKELDALGGALDNPVRPFVAVLGGAKVVDKMGVVESLLPKVDALLIGGGMAYTFLKANGHEIGTSLLDTERIDDCRVLMERAAASGQRLELPTDVVVTTELKADAPRKVVPVDSIPADWMGADIGPETCRRFAEVIKGARTAFWNGPVGVFEIDALAEGTRAIAQ
ncbi:phosphoglycerate kinase, partial [candidate division KD3-62 bacterium DG_56]